MDYNSLRGTQKCQKKSVKLAVKNTVQNATGNKVAVQIIQQFWKKLFDFFVNDFSSKGVKYIQQGDCYEKDYTYCGAVSN